MKIGPVVVNLNVDSGGTGPLSTIQALRSLSPWSIAHGLYGDQEDRGRPHPTVSVWRKYSGARPQPHFSKNCWPRPGLRKSGRLSLRGRGGASVHDITERPAAARRTPMLCPVCSSLETWSGLATGNAAVLPILLPCLWHVSVPSHLGAQGIQDGAGPQDRPDGHSLPHGDAESL
jgi:hypothetical protein